MYIFIDNKRSSSVQYSVHCQVLFQLFLCEPVVDQTTPFMTCEIPFSS